MVELCLNAYNFSPRLGGELDQFILPSVAQEAGFRRVGLDIWSLDAMPGGTRSVERLRQSLDETGVTCHEVLALFIGSNGRAVREDAKRLATVAASLQAAFVVAIADIQPGPRLQESLDTCASIINDGGARLVLECVQGRGVHRLSDAVALCEAAGYERAQLVLDSWQFFRGQDTWSDLEAVPSGSIGYVQFADGDLGSSASGILTDSLHRRALPGRGAFDLETFRDVLLRKGFDGTVSLEVLATDLREIPIRRYAAQVRDAGRAYWDGISPQ